MKYLSIIAVLAFGIQFGHAADACPGLNLPKELKMTARVLSVGISYELKKGDKTFGELQERVLSLGATFEILDESGMLVAQAKQKSVPLSKAGQYHFVVKDCEGRKIGEIQGSQIFEANGELVAFSAREGVFKTTVVVRDVSNKTVVELKRPMLSFPTQSWKVSVSAGSKVDSRLVLLLPAILNAEERLNRVVDSAVDAL